MGGCHEIVKNSHGNTLPADPTGQTVFTSQLNSPPGVPKGKPEVQSGRASANTGGGDASAPTGTSQSGRDHWPRGFSNIWTGGGVTTGPFVGAADKRGEDAVERVCRPDDFPATIYQHVGVDYAKTFIKDFNGRPTAIVDRGKAIPELIG